MRQIFLKTHEPQITEALFKINAFAKNFKEPELKDNPLEITRELNNNQDIFYIIFNEKGIDFEVKLSNDKTITGTKLGIGTKPFEQIKTYIAINLEVAAELLLDWESIIKEYYEKLEIRTFLKNTNSFIYNFKEKELDTEQISIPVSLFSPEEVNNKGSLLFTFTKNGANISYTGSDCNSANEESPAMYISIENGKRIEMDSYVHENKGTRTIYLIPKQVEFLYNQWNEIVENYYIQLSDAKERCKLYKSQEISFSELIKNFNAFPTREEIN